MLFGSEDAQLVSALLRRLRFKELFPLAAVPVGNARQIRYPTEVTVRHDGSRWFVRSYGTEFDLVDPSRRSLRGRWFSLGWGLDDWSHVSELLLVQADDVTRDGLHEVISALDLALGERGARWSSGSGLNRSAGEFRVAAVLRASTQER